METKQLILLVVPLVLINLIFVIFAIRDLLKRERVTGNNKTVWLLVILFVQFFGWISYFLFGRIED